MEHIKILNLFGTIISYFSIMIIVWGVVTSLYRFLLNEVSKADNKEKAYTRGEIRASLGSFILFGLEIRIAADIIDTIARPEINEIIILVAIVLIRTFISYFLQKEIEDAR